MIILQAIILWHLQRKSTRGPLESERPGDVNMEMNYSTMLTRGGRFLGCVYLPGRGDLYDEVVHLTERGKII